MAKFIANQAVFTSGTMSGTNTIVSAASNILSMQTGMYIMSWTGTPVGTFALEGSNNWDNVKQTGTWTALSMVGSGNPAGAPGDTYCQIIDAGMTWVRIKYTNTSGTGTLTASFSAKGNG